jgi:Short C-terminal domain/Phospholipase_D-nuclease N-terminal
MHCGGYDHPKEVRVILAEFGTGQVFWSMLWFFLFFIWIWLLIVVFGDIFRSPDLSGWGKALWSIFIIVVPYLGVFVYLIARGHKMQEHAVQQAQQQDAALRQYVQNVAGTDGGSTAEELARLSELRDKGVLSEAEFQQAKAKALG